MRGGDAEGDAALVCMGARAPVCVGVCVGVRVRVRVYAEIRKRPAECGISD